MPLAAGEISTGFRMDVEQDHTHVAVFRLLLPSSTLPHSLGCRQVLIRQDVTGEIQNHTPTRRSQGRSNYWPSGASWI